jgi:hypothetical protein
VYRYTIGYTANDNCAFRQYLSSSVMCYLLRIVHKNIIRYRLKHTGRFTMHSEITKTYYRKTVGHVFTKPVQIEGTTEFFFPVRCFSSWFTFLPLGDARVCSEKMAAPGDKSFCMLEYHTVSLSLQCNVHFAQSTQRTRLQTRPFVRGINNLLNLGVCASRNQVVAY